ncbi:MAG: MoaD/ThiS family protein [Chloroflexi bacterium]|nr:MoaD/ThiS family protein [Chloroflexota bacterium]
MSTIYIPTPLRRLTNKQSRVQVEAATVREALQALDEAFPGIGERLLDANGEVKRFINVFVNDDNIHTLQGLDTPLNPNDKISIVPAMAGGTVKA